MTDSIPTAVPANLRLTKCPKCDYSLAGLPLNHRCPECGFEYDDRTFVLVGIPRGGAGIGAIRKVLWVVEVLSLMFLPVCVGLATGSRAGTSFSIVLFCLWVGTAIYLLMTGKRERSGTQLFVFAASGFGYCADLASPGTDQNQLIPWTDAHTIRFDRKGAQWQRLRIGASRRFTGKHLDAGIHCDEAAVRWVENVLNQRIDEAHARL